VIGISTGSADRTAAIPSDGCAASKLYWKPSVARTSVE
jgi:hypothetical protein